MKTLDQIKCFLLDMDGTIYLGEKLIDGALEFLSEIKKQNKKYLFITNNSSKNRYSYVEKLKRLSINANSDDVFTSGEAATIYLSKIKPSAKIYLLGTKELENEFIEAGFQLVPESGAHVDFVVLGFDTTITYDKIWAACDYIREGTPFYATHPDFNCPIEDGKFMPDTGSFIKLFEASTGVAPIVIGKPNKPIINAISEKYNLSPDEIAMVGDRLYTDIKMGENAGIASILVYSGETTPEDYADSDIKADFIFDSVKDIYKALKE